MSLSQSEIVLAAVSLLDRHGLESLTLRRLAKELGVSAPTIYWHVDDKRHLFDLMVEEIYGRAELSPEPVEGEPWWRWLASNARAQRSVLISIRDAALVVAGNRPTERSFPYIEKMLQSLVLAGLAAPTALKALRSLNDYVVGSAIEHQAMMSRSVTTNRDAVTASDMRASDSYPLLRAALGGPEESLETIFEAGLQWFVAGLRSEVGEPASSAGRTSATPD